MSFTKRRPVPGSSTYQHHPGGTLPVIGKGGELLHLNHHQPLPGVDGTGGRGSPGVSATAGATENASPLTSDATGRKDHRDRTPEPPEGRGRWFMGETSCCRLVPGVPA